MAALKVIPSKHSSLVKNSSSLMQNPCGFTKTPQDYNRDIYLPTSHAYDAEKSSCDSDKTQTLSVPTDFEVIAEGRISRFHTTSTIFNKAEPKHNTKVTTMAKLDATPTPSVETVEKSFVRLAVTEVPEHEDSWNQESLPEFSTALGTSSVDKLRMDRSKYGKSNPYETVAIGSIIRREGKILLLQRAAGKKAIYPILNSGCFELPTRIVETENYCLGTELQRVTIENTGLKITSVVGELATAEYDILYGGRLGPCAQLNFVVEVEGMEKIVLDPEAHEKAVWVSEEEVKGLEITPTMRRMVRMAFGWNGEGMCKEEVIL